MAVTTTKLGVNSWEFDYTTGTTAAEITAALDAVIVGELNNTGWTIHDNVSDVVKCYKALNQDGETFKYVVLDLATANVLLIKHYETWDELTHTGTNMAHMSDNVLYAGKYTITGPGQIFLYISEMWFAVATRDPATGQLNNNNAWQGIFGVFEIARDNPEDTAEAGYPPTVWMNTNMMFTNPTTSVKCCGFMPRTRSGAVGAAAMVEVSTILGRTRSDTIVKLGNFIPTATNIWNNKDWALTLYVIEPGFVARGRVYGLKGFTTSKNLFMDKASVVVDADYFYNIAGESKDHFIVVNGAYGTAPGRVLIPS